MRIRVALLHTLHTFVRNFFELLFILPSIELGERPLPSQDE